MARPIAVHDDRIVLVRLHGTEPDPAAAEALGRRLGATHASGAPSFGSPPAGWDADGFIGPIRLPHRPSARWGVFYAAERLRPYARQAGTQGP
jgi:fructosamine-3-kinase